MRSPLGVTSPLLWSRPWARMGSLLSNQTTRRKRGAAVRTEVARYGGARGRPDQGPRRDATRGEGGAVEGQGGGEDGRAGDRAEGARPAERGRAAGEASGGAYARAG